MSILKANILTEVNRRCNRNLSNVNYEIRAVLIDYSLVSETVCTEATTNVVAGTASYDLLTFPEPFRTADAVKIDDNDPLVRIRTMAEYQALIADETSADRDEPEAYLIYNNMIYLHPTPDTTYTMTIYASSIQMDEDSILLPDHMEEMLIEGVCYKVYEGLGQGKAAHAIPHLENYVNYRQKFIGLENRKASTGSAAYNDI
ncbi:MAG TPA: hypothetical protein PLZ78_08870 [Spirochaetota bacterium]|nr:hypothetical protein [Spirochaetota bacterium]